jgi:NTE family protein
MSRQRINLALQGGGAHGAFTWGVLDRLAGERWLDIAWISGTSAGAVNAVAFAAGLMEGGRDRARAKLADVWTAVHKAAVPDLVRNNPLFASLSRSTTLQQITSLFSPYDLNPHGYDPLRRLLETHIDFERLRKTDGPDLLIAATDVATGTARLFRRAELRIEHVLASACLPTIHHAVEIDGRAYWDGGFAANPDLITLARRSPARDTLLVLLSPFVKAGRPTTARDIAAHIAHLTFNAPLLREIQRIDDARQRGLLARGLAGHRLARHRFHLIDASRFTGALPADSKAKPELELITYLHGVGVAETGKWLERTRHDLGRRETADLARRLADAHRGSLGEEEQATPHPTHATSPDAAA